MANDKDLEYLQGYMTIAEQFLGGTIKIGDRYGDYDDEDRPASDEPDAITLLSELNAKFPKGSITESLRKTRVLGSHLAGPEGWTPSSVCY